MSSDAGDSTYYDDDDLDAAQEPGEITDTDDRSDPTAPGDDDDDDDVKDAALVVEVDLAELANSLGATDTAPDPDDGDTATTDDDADNDEIADGDQADGDDVNALTSDPLDQFFAAPDDTVSDRSDGGPLDDAADADLDGTDDVLEVDNSDDDDDDDDAPADSSTRNVDLADGDGIVDNDSNPAGDVRAETPETADNDDRDANGRNDTPDPDRDTRDDDDVAALLDDPTGTSTGGTGPQSDQRSFEAV